MNKEIKFEPIKAVVSGLVQALGINPKGSALVSIVEQQLDSYGGHAKVAGFKNNKIYIEADSSVHLQELTFRKQEILKCLRDAFPERNKESVPEIKFFIKGLARPTRKEMVKSYYENKN